MSTTIAIIAIIAGIIGIIGSIVPGLPGPPLSWVGLLLLYLWGKEPMTTGFLLLWLAITVVVTIIDYFVPVYFTKLTGGSKYAGWGAMIGLFAGLIIPPVGMIVGSLLGAFVAEFIFAKKRHLHLAEIVPRSLSRLYFRDRHQNSLFGSDDVLYSHLRFLILWTFAIF